MVFNKWTCQINSKAIFHLACLISGRETVRNFLSHFDEAAKGKGVRTFTMTGGLNIELELVATGATLSN